MELKLDLNYRQLLKLIYQLPEKDKKKLVANLRSNFTSKKNNSKPKIQSIILEAPTWNEEELSEYQERRQHINKSRLV